MGSIYAIIRKVVFTVKHIKNNLISYFNKKEIENKLLKKFLGLNVETTNICNANCTFCGYQYQTRATGCMDRKLFEKIILEYVEIGGGDLGLGPTVGDTLADKYIIERIKFARSFDKIKNELGYRPRRKLDDGIKEMYNKFVEISMNENDFLDKKFYRAKYLKWLIEQKMVNYDLRIC